MTTLEIASDVTVDGDYVVLRESGNPDGDLFRVSGKTIALCRPFRNAEAPMLDSTSKAMLLRNVARVVG